MMRAKAEFSILKPQEGAWGNMRLPARRVVGLDGGQLAGRGDAPAHAEGPRQDRGPRALADH